MKESPGEEPDYETDESSDYWEEIHVAGCFSEAVIAMFARPSSAASDREYCEEAGDAS